MVLVFSVQVSFEYIIIEPGVESHLLLILSLLVRFVPWLCLANFKVGNFYDHIHVAT